MSRPVLEIDLDYKEVLGLQKVIQYKEILGVVKKHWKDNLGLYKGIPKKRNLEFVRKLGF